MNKIPKYFLLDNAFAMGAYWICSGVVVASFTSFYEIPVSVANVLSGMTSTLALLQMPGGLVFSESKKKNRFLRFFNIVWRLLLPMIFFTVLLPQNIGALVFVLFVPIMMGMFQLSAPAQTAWLVDATAGQIKPSYFSVREMVFMFYHTVLLCTSYVIIDVSQKGGWQQQGFVILGVIVSASIIASLVVFARLPNVKENDDSENNKKKKFNLIEKFRPVLKNKQFVRVMTVNVMWSFAAMFVGSFSAVYQVRTLEMSFSLILVWSTVGNIARAALTPVVQRIAQKISWQRTCQLMMLIYISAAIAWYFTNKENVQYLYPFAAVLNAIPFAGIGVGFLQLQVNAMEKDADRTVHFSLLAMLNGAASLLGTTICTALISALSLTATGDLRPIFLVGVASMTVTLIYAERINMHKNNKANRINEAISKIKAKYPNLALDPLPKTRRKLRFILRKRK